MGELMYCGMPMTVENVTPAIAKKWLKNNIRNRKLKSEWVKKYARDMIFGDWQPIPLAIVFDKKGILGNGQTRLSAIIQSGTTQPFLIARKVSDESIAMMDRGSVWSNNDTSKFLGHSLNTKKVAVAQILAFGLGSKNKSYQEILGAYLEYEDQISFITALCPNKKGFPAPMMAVCVKAMYSYDPDEIEKFIEIMKTGIVESPKDSAAIKLRDSLMASVSNGGVAGQLDTYRKTQSALKAFLDRRPIKSLVPSEKDHFPIV